MIFNIKSDSVASSGARRTTCVVLFVFAAAYIGSLTTATSGNGSIVAALLLVVIVYLVAAKFNSWALSWSNARSETVKNEALCALASLVTDDLHAEWASVLFGVFARGLALVYAVDQFLVGGAYNGTAASTSRSDFTAVVIATFLEARVEWSLSATVIVARSTGCVFAGFCWDAITEFVSDKTSLAEAARGTYGRDNDVAAFADRIGTTSVVLFALSSTLLDNIINLDRAVLSGYAHLRPWVSKVTLLAVTASLAFLRAPNSCKLSLTIVALISALTVLFVLWAGCNSGALFWLNTLLCVFVQKVSFGALATLNTLLSAHIALLNWVLTSTDASATASLVDLESDCTFWLDFALFLWFTDTGETVLEESVVAVATWFWFLLFVAKELGSLVTASFLAFSVAGFFVVLVVTTGDFFVIVDDTPVIGVALDDVDGS